MSPAAVAAAAQYQDIFGKDGFFIEVQDHGLSAQDRVMDDLVAIAGDIGAPLLATNDSHYTYAAEADAHDVLLCIQTGANRRPNPLSILLTLRADFYHRCADFDVLRLAVQDRQIYIGAMSEDQLRRAPLTTQLCGVVGPPAGAGPGLLRRRRCCPGRVPGDFGDSP